MEKTVRFENKFENPIFQGILKGKNTQTGEKSFILSKSDHSIDKYRSINLTERSEVNLITGFANLAALHLPDLALSSAFVHSNPGRQTASS